MTVYGLRTSVSLFALGAFLIGADSVCAQTAQPAAGSPATAESGGLETVIVTAEKRETNVQRTPISIDTVTGESIKGTGPADIASLSLTMPSVLFGQANAQSQITIRGIGNDQVGPGFEARTASHIDGVYIASLNGILGSLYDLDRVEVAEGPQGDLYGRNATAGAVNVITHKPSLEEGLNGYFQLTGGNYGLVEAQGAVGDKLDDTFAFRVAGDLVSRGGYGQDTYTHTPINDQKSRAIRGSFLWEPTSNLSILGTVDYFNEDDANYTAVYGGTYNEDLSPAELTALVAPATLTIGGVPTKVYGNIPVGVLAGSPVAKDKNDISEDSAPHYYNNEYGANLTVNYRLSDAFSLRSITGYRYNYHNQEVPTDFTAQRVVTNGVFERVSSISEELQLIGDFWHQHLVAGLYYFDDKNFAMIENAEGYPETIGGQHVPPGSYYEFTITGANLTTTSKAAYIHDEIDFTDELSLTLGGRYTSDKLDEADISDNPPVQQGLIPTTGFPFPIPAVAFLSSRSVTYNNFSPRVTLSYKPDDDTMLYATWTKGFKSGGFNPGSDRPPLAASILPPFKPEQLTDYEAGVKKDWFDHHLRTNISGFYYDYKNLQVQQKDQNAIILITNAATATLYGVEASLQAVITDHLTLNGGVSLLHTQYDDFCNADANRSLTPTSPTCAAQGFPAGTQDLHGNALNRAPNYVANIGGDYVWPTWSGMMDAHFDATFTDKEYFSPFNTETLVSPAHSLLNASLRYDTTKGMYAEAWIKNIADKQAPETLSVSGLSTGSNISSRLSPPRTFGLTLGYTFQ